MIEPLDLHQDFSHLGDDIHAKVWARPVSRLPDRFYFEPDKASMCKDQLKFRELGNDRAVRVVALGKIESPYTRVFLVDHLQSNLTERHRSGRGGESGAAQRQTDPQTKGTDRPGSHGIIVPRQ